jgi:hypothetical protein
VKKVIALEKWYIRTAHCKRRQGKSVVLTMDGEFKYDYDFIFGAGNVGSVTSEAICGAYALRIKETSGKSL